MTPAIIRRPQYDEQNPFPQQGQPLPQVPTMAPQLQMAPVDPHHAITAPLGPMPQPQPMGIDGQPKSEAQPKMSAQPKSDLDTQEQQMTAQRDKLEWEKHNSYGSANNHPGFMGKLLHGLSMAGNIAGNIFAPSTMALIPGTQLNRQVEEGQLNRGIQGIEKEKGEQANQQSEEGLREAQVRNLDSEVAERNQPADKKLTTIQTDQGWMSFDPATGMIAPLQADGKALQSPDKKAAPILHETDQGLMLVDPMTREVTPLTLNGQPLMPKKPESGTKTVQLQIGGRPHQVLVDEHTGNVVRDLGESGEKPPTINVNAERRLGMAEKGAVMKEYTPALDSAERFNVMSENYERAIKDHDQQAMLSLLANHLGMTMGLQKGARLTKDIIHEAAQSRPWLQGLKATFDKDGYLSGVNLTPAQMKQMVDLGRSRFAEDMTKARSQARYLGATDDGPERIPNKSTMRSYLAMANGDVTRAKQMAAEDGWSVK